MKERYKLLILVSIFLIAYFVPWDNPVIRQSGLEAFMMLREYARGTCPDLPDSGLFHCRGHIHFCFSSLGAEILRGPRPVR